MKEKNIKAANGYIQLLLNILLIILAVVSFIFGISGESVFLIVASVVLVTLWVFHLPGFFTLQPNEAMVLILFGTYKGTVKDSGFSWVNPFMTKKKISQRARNLNGEKLKVNDQMGNPIEIAAVVVWHIENTAQAFFDVENYGDYVKVQSESALRHLTNLYPYDLPEDHAGFSLRGSADEVAGALKVELQERLGRAGVVVEEARLSHLAYAPEIAQAMLQRQQAAAIIAARQKIVEGAVGMVQMALNKLAENDIVTLDEDRKAAMVSNLLVVLCSERNTQPIVNAGSIF